jgi:2-haloacid dehalogenase
MRYDCCPPTTFAITNKVYVPRGYEPTNPYYGHHEVKDLSGPPPLLGLGARPQAVHATATRRRVHS